MLLIRQLGAACAQRPQGVRHAGATTDPGAITAAALAAASKAGRSRCLNSSGGGGTHSSNSSGGSDPSHAQLANALPPAAVLYVTGLSFLVVSFTYGLTSLGKGQASLNDGLDRLNEGMGRYGHKLDALLFAFDIYVPQEGTEFQRKQAVIPAPPATKTWRGILGL